MKAISLWQPWASLWLTERKIHETRHWATGHRGWLLVHAAKHFERDVEPELAAILDDEFGGHWGRELPTGALLGIVRLTSVLKTCGNHGVATVAANPDDLIAGNWSPGRYAWRRDEIIPFCPVLPYRGAQALFNVPDDWLEACGVNVPELLI